jgi:hypothetical protein
MKHSPLPTNIYVLHNLAHIELNAIDLAWDTVARFSGLGLPEDFYADFARWVGRYSKGCLQVEGLRLTEGIRPAQGVLRRLCQVGVEFELQQG